MTVNPEKSLDKKQFDRIIKLVLLMDNSNENEAQNSFLKAREAMQAAGLQFSTFLEMASNSAVPTEITQKMQEYERIVPQLVAENKSLRNHIKQRMLLTGIGQNTKVLLGKAASALKPVVKISARALNLTTKAAGWGYRAAAWPVLFVWAGISGRIPFDVQYKDTHILLRVGSVAIGTIAGAVYYSFLTSQVPHAVDFLKRAEQGNFLEPQIHAQLLEDLGDGSSTMTTPEGFVYSGQVTGLLNGTRQYGAVVERLVALPQDETLYFRGDNTVGDSTLLSECARLRVYFLQEAADTPLQRIPDRANPDTEMVICDNPVINGLLAPGPN